MATQKDSKPTKRDGRLFVATESYTTMYEGDEVYVQAGITRAREGHPIMRGREAMWKVLEGDYDFDEDTAVGPRGVTT